MIAAVARALSYRQPLPRKEATTLMPLLLCGFQMGAKGASADKIPYCFCLFRQHKAKCNDLRTVIVLG
jgi:hypothetical protein